MYNIDISFCYGKNIESMSLKWSAFSEWEKKWIKNHCDLALISFSIRQNMKILKRRNTLESTEKFSPFFFLSSLPPSHVAVLFMSSPIKWVQKFAWNNVELYHSETFRIVVPCTKCQPGCITFILHKNTLFFKDVLL